MVLQQKKNAALWGELSSNREVGAMVDVDVKTLLEDNIVFEEFKGALTEQFVLQQLVVNKELATYYWSAENATSEIDF
ncbi:DUF4143 domain-containing protein [Pedobacter sp. JCM 36344]|uniref:DUF4143 domain-containing protein n=1 Tax=Pedobacter sp. JCM 36344 TaxID=3374280 RepID=UPI00397ADF98